MLVWRATVDLMRNIGEPSSAEWVYPGEMPSTDRYKIQQDVERYVMLTYPNPGNEFPGIGWWTPGQDHEYVFFPTNGGTYDNYISNYYVWHDPVPEGRGLNRQHHPHVEDKLIQIGELAEDWVNFMTQELHGRGSKYIKNYIDRYIVTTRKYSVNFTPEQDRYLRDSIAKIFKETDGIPHDEVEDHVWLEWQRSIMANPENGHDYDRFNNLSLDPNFLDYDYHFGIVYNKKGFKKVPANKADVIKFKNTDIKHNPPPSFKQPPPIGTTRRRKARMRDKKLLKEYYKDMREQGDDPDANYDGGSRVTRKRKQHGPRYARKY